MKRIILILIFLLAVISLSAVSADENSTEVMADDVADDLNDLQTVDEISSDADDSLKEQSGEEIVKENSSDDTKATSEITASAVTGYDGTFTKITLKLTADGKPLVNKEVSILLDGLNYTKTTDNNGEASISVLLKKGSYDAVFSYAGDNSTSAATATSTVTIKSQTKTKLVVGDKYINYRQGSKCLFYVKLLTSSGKAIKGQEVKFKVAGKAYTAKTSKSGIAKIYLKLKKGKYKVKYSFKNSPKYVASSGSYKIKVKSKMAKGNGYWLWPAHMKSVNLKSLAKKGTKHLFLHVQALSVYGKSSVVSFIKSAHKRGIKVHLWMQVCYSGGKWVSPVKNDGSFKYGFIKQKIKEAKKYAKIKGVDGVHFDYMRYGGTAHKHKNAVESINYIVKKAAVKIHKAKPNCIVSGALMPEQGMMEYYYGQDVATLSRYVDALLPMVYKGNYHQTRSWIKSVTKTFVQQSRGAQIWTGLQSYHSDSDTSKLSQSSLLKDAKAAKKGGALGIVLFRIGISCNFNFKKV